MIGWLKIMAVARGGRLLLAALASTDWTSCLGALHADEVAYYRCARCGAKFDVQFDWRAYATRVRPVAAATSPGDATAPPAPPRRHRGAAQCGAAAGEVGGW